MTSNPSRIAIAAPKSKSGIATPREGEKFLHGGDSSIDNLID